MKHQSMIKYAAITGLVAGSINASAAGFGGGWMHDKDTGTLYYSRATEVKPHASSGQGQDQAHLNSFGGGWMQDRNTGTLFYSRAPEVKPHAGPGQEHDQARLNSFGGGWMQDRNTNTLTYSPVAERADNEIAALDK